MLPGSVRLCFVVLAALLVLAAPSGLRGQDLTEEQRDRGERILEQLRKDLAELYYDTTYGGTSLEARVELTRSRLESVTTPVQMFAVLAEFLAGLSDSHTALYPPRQVAEIEYGYRLLFVGDTCYVERVREGSNAAQAGLRPGDAVIGLDRFRLERDSFWLVQYLYYILSPRPQVVLTVRSPGSAERQVTVAAKVTPGQVVWDMNDPNTRFRLRDEFYRDRRSQEFRWTVVDSVLVWKMPSFQVDARRDIDVMLGEARRHSVLVLDLRDNPGGAVITQEHLISGLFDREVHVSTMRERANRHTRMAKPASRPYTGRLIVLVNSASGSSAEIVARVLQIERRGLVLGDRTAGAVMTSMGRGHMVGFARGWTYGATITVADVVMSDGGRLEKVGVQPDELILPTAEDLAAGHDPVLARALALAGVNLDAAAASRLLENTRPD